MHFLLFNYFIMCYDLAVLFDDVFLLFHYFIDVLRLLSNV
jgi:hypothetical protein